MTHRYVTIPRPVTVSVETQNGTQTAPMPFAMFIRGRYTDSKHFGESLDTVLRAAALDSAFRSAGEGDVVPVLEADWEKLCLSIKQPGAGYLPAVMLQILDYTRAVLDAPTTKPEALAVAAE
jgi:hypothetical protein